MSPYCTDCEMIQMPSGERNATERQYCKASAFSLLCCAIEVNYLYNCIIESLNFVKSEHINSYGRYKCKLSPKISKIMKSVPGFLDWLPWLEGLAKRLTFVNHNMIMTYLNVTFI